MYKSKFNPHVDLGGYFNKRSSFSDNMNSDDMDNVVKQMKEKLGSRKIVFCLDHDGALAHTNGLKDEQGGNFCRKEPNLGEVDIVVAKENIISYKDNSKYGQLASKLFIEIERIEKQDKKDVDWTKTLFDFIHHNAHGEPMWAIFNTLSTVVYGKKNQGQKEGEDLTEGLNFHIKDDYANQPALYGIDLYLQILNELGTCVIMTGMETDLVEKSVLNHSWQGLLDGIYGSPNTKAENLKLLKEKYGANAEFYFMGDGSAELKLANEEKLPFVKVAVPDPRDPGKKLKFSEENGHDDSAVDSAEMLVMQLAHVFEYTDNLKEWMGIVNSNMENAIKSDQNKQIDSLKPKNSEFVKTM